MVLIINPLLESHSDLSLSFHVKAAAEKPQLVVASTYVDVGWGLPRCVWARESTAPAQGNQSLSRELRASALCPGLEAQFPACRRKREISLQYYKKLGPSPIQYTSEISYHPPRSTRRGDAFLLNFCNRFQTSNKPTHTAHSCSLFFPLLSLLFLFINLF